MFKFIIAIFSWLVSLSTLVKAQQLLTTSPARETVVSYSYTFELFNNVMKRQDTLLIRNNMVLELMWQPWVVDSINHQTGKLTGSSKGTKLKWAYLTNLTDMKGVCIDLDQKPLSSATKAYTTKTKNLGYSLLPEPYLHNGNSIENYFAIKDTVVKNQRCLIVESKKAISTTSNNMPDSLISVRLLINKDLKHLGFPFISDQICERFGGAIILAESRYKSGLKFTAKFDYLCGFPTNYRRLFQECLAIYQYNSP